MSWESPIEMIIEDIDQKMTDGVVQMIQKVHINVDKDELIKALQYDRNQYEKGYEDGKNDIIRCKDCVYSEGFPWSACPMLGTVKLKDDDFCSRGERITDE